MNPRLPYLAAYRGSRANGDPQGPPPEPGAPVGAQSYTSIQDEMDKWAMPMEARQRARQQAESLRRGAVGPAGWQGLAENDKGGQEVNRTSVSNAYGAGGFDAVKQTKDWYDLPAHVRTQILAGASGRMG